MAQGAAGRCLHGEEVGQRGFLRRAMSEVLADGRGDGIRVLAAHAQHARHALTPLGQAGQGLGQEGAPLLLQQQSQMGVKAVVQEVSSLVLVPG